MTRKTICVLANSFKNSERCIAGMEVIQKNIGGWSFTKRWIRPISHRPSGAISLQESHLSNTGKHPKILDIISVPVQKQAQVVGQPEDWLIDPNNAWEHRGELDKCLALTKLLQNPKDLWIEENERMDRVSTDFVGKHSLPSLYLIEPEKLEIVVQPSNSPYNPMAKKIRGRFVFGGKQYDLSLTDPEAGPKYVGNLQEAKYGVARRFRKKISALCVSLTPAWKGDFCTKAYHYKILATIIE